jgi:DNA invertase Pin-like site-specific DNA recombinase
METSYSYVRFSAPQQSTGDSVRRQTEARDRWLAAHPTVVLDHTLRMRDDGRSAWKRTDWATYALAEFVEHVKSGRVEAGSYLLLENLDRLSREDVGTATELFLTLVNRGIILVQLLPVATEFRKPVNVQNLMFAIFELSRGNSESVMKSERVGAAWANKRKRAAQEVVTRRLPGWIRYDEDLGKLVLIPDRAAIVRRIFEMVLAGKGVWVIAKTLNDEGVPVMGRKEFKGRLVAWSETVVYYVLISKATYGEFQLYKGRGSAKHRHAVGEPISDYFPPAIAKETYDAARGLLARRARPGRRGKHVNLFSGLLVDARDGGSLTYKHLKGRPHAIVPVGAKQGRGSVWSCFPADPLDRAIRSELIEIKAADIQGDDGATRKVEALSGRLAEVKKLIAAWEAKMDDPDIVDTVAAKLAELNARRKAIERKLAEAQREAASPIAEAWGEFRTLAGLNPDDDTDELRTKIKAALRRSVKSIYCLFTGTNVNRIAAIQVWFADGKTHRDYFVLYRRGVANRYGRKFEGRSGVRSLNDVVKLGAVDLRRPADAAKVEKALAVLDLEKLKRLLTPPG